MANPEHVAIVKKGSEAIARWQAHHPTGRLNLSWADLHEADLSDADLREGSVEQQ